MSDQGWRPPEPPPSIHNPPSPPGGGWSPQPPPPGGGWSPQPPPPGAGWSPPPYGGYGYSGPPTGGTEPLSTWSLVLGILSFVLCPFVAAIPAIITGAKAKKAIAASGGARSGHGAAVAGQILGVVNIVLSVLAGVGVAVLIAAASHHVSYTRLAVGDCFNREGSDSIFSDQVTPVSCSKPHEGEVVGTYEDPSTGGWPGASGFQATALPRCNDFAQQYVTVPTDSLGILYLYPKRATWDADTTHKVVCAVRNTDGSRRTGSTR